MNLKKFANYFFSFFVVILLLLTVFYLRSEVKKKPKVIIKTKKVQKIVKVPMQNTNIIVSIDNEDLNSYLIQYEKQLSIRQRKVILTAIKETADKYKISPLILFAIIGVESSFRSYITHKQVIIKGKKDNAIGLTAIVYSWWGEKLKKAGIIETKTDLYDPTLNIESCGFVFNELRKLPLKKGTKDPNVSAMRRYFGGNFKSYSTSIKNKIGIIVFKKIYKEKKIQGLK